MCTAYRTCIADTVYSYLHKNSQAVKKGVALKSLGKKSCEIKSGGQEMAAMMLMLIVYSYKIQCVYSINRHLCGDSK